VDLTALSTALARGLPAHPASSSDPVLPVLPLVPWRTVRDLRWDVQRRRRAERYARRQLVYGRLVAPRCAPHGTLSGYQDWGCRCGACREVSTAATTRWRADRRVASELIDLTEEEREVSDDDDDTRPATPAELQAALEDDVALESGVCPLCSKPATAEQLVTHLRRGCP
jgi:hypothetical protein